LAKNNQPAAAISAQDPLHIFHSAVRHWFEGVFAEPTRPQIEDWPAIARGESTLILAPTGPGKTLAAFWWCINFAPAPAPTKRCRILYISPIKALAVYVERNLPAPLVGIAQAAQRLGEPFHEPSVSRSRGSPGWRSFTDAIDHWRAWEMFLSRKYASLAESIRFDGWLACALKKWNAW
jgi:ATP-dependent Lhr-like helicase